MTTRKRKKSRKLRGRTRTMGWGRIGQHRKSGSRGGFGAVGYHKHKVTWMIKYAPYWYGKHGFTRPKAVKKEIKSINVGDLNEIAIKLLTSGKAVKENNLIVLNLVEMGYDKVLGKGKVSLPLKILVKKITEEARK
ncbi:MAG: uL15 family ribosomal protein, partial [Desulfurococcaceae archaeon]